jgi:hypothetical protein
LTATRPRRDVLVVAPSHASFGVRVRHRSLPRPIGWREHPTNGQLRAFAPVRGIHRMRHHSSAPALRLRIEFRGQRITCATRHGHCLPCRNLPHRLRISSRRSTRLGASRGAWSSKPAGRRRPNSNSPPNRCARARRRGLFQSLGPRDARDTGSHQNGATTQEK